MNVYTIIDLLYKINRFISKKKYSMTVEHSMNLSITLILYKSEQCITRQRFFNNEENQFFNTLRAK